MLVPGPLGIATTLFCPSVGKAVLKKKVAELDVQPLAGVDAPILHFAQQVQGWQGVCTCDVKLAQHNSALHPESGVLLCSTGCLGSRP